MSSKTLAKIVLNTREVHLKVCFSEESFWATTHYTMCLAVMYFNKLQSVCEGKVGAWGLKTSLTTRFDMLEARSEKPAVTENAT